MKKSIFIICLVACGMDSAITSCAQTPVQQLTKIMFKDSTSSCPCTLAQKRNSEDMQRVYSLVKDHPELARGIIHEEQTFAMLCVKRGYADLLLRLVNEGYPVDCATACREFGSGEPESLVLHRLFQDIKTMRQYHKMYSDDYSAMVEELTKKIIRKDPALLDLQLDREKTARQVAQSLGLGSFLDLSDLLQVTKNTASVNLVTLYQNEGSYAVEALLADSNIDLNQAYENGTTLLLAACQNRDNWLVCKLLENKHIDVNKADHDGQTPLLAACKSNGANLNINMIDALLKKGARNTPNKEGQTPLSITQGANIHSVLKRYL